MDSGDPSCGFDAMAFIFSSRHAGISCVACAVLLAEHENNEKIKIVIVIG